MKDLIVAVADSYQEKVIEALLPRMPLVSGTTAFSYDIIQNIGKDSGSYNDSHELLRPYFNDYKYSLVIFDYEGCGAENNKKREEIEAEVESLLSRNGWSDRTSVIVISPELENWMWINNPNVQDAIGWEKQETLYEWAIGKNYIQEGGSKPHRPKEVLEEALRISSTPKSSAVYKKIAATVSYKNCQDPAFHKLIAMLQQWFSNQ